MNEYTCYLCGGEFINEFPEEEKMAEYEHYFPTAAQVSPEGRCSVCEDCWQKVHPERN